ncbi:transcriptional regulator [Egibacter rhizosphaerae]|uniref:Transcriptional regulator n=1 Tax=Egibacter rhizosphaerae TaxID=1670831 RepID=A0A411YBG3_9ACTN|nr:transcriptional regulator [Egibacter rhizosphaerae]QBI18593.1 transcriptional regulator [Egibacter rhizosphaerae]
MSHNSPPDLLVLHAVRITGFADTATVARRFDLDEDETQELLRDAEAHGWTTYTAFGDTAGWSLTERGRAESERQLASELTSTRGADDVRHVYREFLPLNAVVLRACTDWQLKPAPGDRLVPNDHTDPAWDANILRELTTIDRALRPLIDRLGNRLTRFRGYDKRFTTALTRAQTGEPAWVDRTDIDSCHRVWFELHEDLIATLGIDRRTGPG